MKVILSVNKEKSIRIIQQYLDTNALLLVSMSVDGHRVGVTDLPTVNLYAAQFVKLEGWSASKQASYGMAFKMDQGVIEIWGHRDCLAGVFYTGWAFTQLKLSKMVDYSTQHKPYRWWDTEAQGRTRLIDKAAGGYRDRFKTLTGKEPDDCKDKSISWFNAMGVPVEIRNWVKEE